MKLKHVFIKRVGATCEVRDSSQRGEVTLLPSMAEWRGYSEKRRQSWIPTSSWSGPSQILTHKASWNIPLQHWLRSQAATRKKWTTRVALHDSIQFSSDYHHHQCCLPGTTCKWMEWNNTIYWDTTLLWSIITAVHVKLFYLYSFVKKKQQLCITIYVHTGFICNIIYTQKNWYNRLKKYYS